MYVFMQIKNTYSLLTFMFDIMSVADDDHSSIYIFYLYLNWRLNIIYKRNNCDAVIDFHYFIVIYTHN